jgi:D-arabinose 5-phosphate isomerase GutQ
MIDKPRSTWSLVACRCDAQGAEWVHGDLGTAREGDVAVVLSHSGATPELVGAAAHLRAKGVRLLAITGRPDSPLAQKAQAHLCAGVGMELSGRTLRRLERCAGC